MSLCAKDVFELGFPIEWDNFSLSLPLSLCLSDFLSFFFSLSPLLFHTAGRKEGEEREDAKNSHSFDQ